MVHNVNHKRVALQSKTKEMSRLFLLAITPLIFTKSQSHKIPTLTEAPFARRFKMFQNVSPKIAVEKIVYTETLGDLYVTDL